MTSILEFSFSVEELKRLKEISDMYGKKLSHVLICPDGSNGPTHEIDISCVLNLSQLQNITIYYHKINHSHTVKCCKLSDKMKK